MGKGYGQSRYLQKMIGLIQKNDPSITSVVLNGFDIIDAKLAVLAMALVANTQVTSLHLDGNDISDHGAELLAYVLRMNQTIEYLSVNDNRIQSAGADALASTLYENKTLTTLRLANNSIGNDGARRLRKMLRHNATLREIVLDGNDIAQSSLDKFDDRCSWAPLKRRGSFGDVTATTAAASEFRSSANSEAGLPAGGKGGEEELDSSGQEWEASSQSSLFDASFYMGNDDARRYVIGSFEDEEEVEERESGDGGEEGPDLSLSWENLVSYMANIQDDIDRGEGAELYGGGGARPGEGDEDDLSVASEEPRRDPKPLEKHKRRWKMFKRRPGKVHAHKS